MTPTPQERAEKIVGEWLALGKAPDAESIRVAIVEATNAEVEKRRKAEAFGLTMEMLLRCHAEKVLHIMAGPIGSLSDGMDAAREHAAVCPEDPTVKRLAESQAEVAALKARLADLRRPTHGPCCTCQRCGKHYDNCRCNLDAVVDDLEIANQRLAAREKDIAEAVEKLQVAMDVGAEYPKTVREYIYAAIEALQRGAEVG